MPSPLREFIVVHDEGRSARWALAGARSAAKVSALVSPACELEAHPEWISSLDRATLRANAVDLDGEKAVHGRSTIVFRTAPSISGATNTKGINQ